MREKRYAGVGKDRKFGRVRDCCEFLDPSELVDLFGIVPEWERLPPASVEAGGVAEHRGSDAGACSVPQVLQGVQLQLPGVAVGWRG